MKRNAKDYVSTANSSSRPTMPTTSMACSVYAQMAHWTICPIRRESVVRSVVASMLFGARFRMPFRTFESK